MADLDEQQLARLIALLRPAPESWVAAAQQLPAARAAIDSLTERAQASVRERQTIINDLDAALRREGIEPQASVVRELKARLAPPS